MTRQRAEVAEATLAMAEEEEGKGNIISGCFFHGRRQVLSRISNQEERL